MVNSKPTNHLSDLGAVFSMVQCELVLVPLTKPNGFLLSRPLRWSRIGDPEGDITRVPELTPEDSWLPIFSVLGDPTWHSGPLLAL